MTPLCELGAKFGTDKFKPHNYTPLYYKLLHERRQTITRFLEVGIHRGASLYMWEAFFPNAHVYGMDKNPDFLTINRGRISSHWGNQIKPEKLANVARGLGGDFDVIVEDGSHHPDNQIRALQSLLQFVRPDGYYFIEDIRGDGDIDRIREHIPAGYSNHMHRSDKEHPKHGFEKMLVIWRSEFVTPDL